MNPITIKPLTSELNKDYLDFFDNRAFTDGNPNGPCYCTSPNQDEETIKKMVKKFKIFGVKKTLRKYAVKMLNENKIHGYLAFDGDVSIGWCNAADIDSYGILTLSVFSVISDVADTVYLVMLSAILMICTATEALRKTIFLKRETPLR